MVSYCMVDTLPADRPRQDRLEVRVGMGLPGCGVRELLAMDPTSRANAADIPIKLIMPCFWYTLTLASLP
jgi:hypothetical protein